MRKRLEGKETGGEREYKEERKGEGRLSKEMRKRREGEMSCAPVWSHSLCKDSVQYKLCRPIGAGKYAGLRGRWVTSKAGRERENENEGSCWW